jgi:hypothetical protein
MMSEQIEVTIVPSKDIIVESALLLLRAVLRKWCIIIFGIFLIGCISDDLNEGFRFTDLITFGIILGLLAGILFYGRWRFVRKLRKKLEGIPQNDLKCVYRFTKGAVILTSVAGEKTLPWEKMKRIFASPRVIVFNIRHITVPLPISDISAEIKEFIRAKVVENRIKLYGRQAEKFFAL